MIKNSQPIGIFDSGIGGLTVVKEIVKALPNEKIVYFGDTARLPYGNKSADTVIKFSLENTRFLLEFGVKMIIVACNTSSSVALATLRRRFNIPFLGVISPAVKEAVSLSSGGRIGIIGTRATVESKTYQRQIKKINPSFKSFTQACPLFVPLAEEGWIDDQLTYKVAQRYLSSLLKKNIDTLILGCTHYPILRGVIERVMGSKISYVDSARETANQARELLVSAGILSGDKANQANCKFYVSDEPAVFKKVGKKFLGKTIRIVRKA